MSKDFDRPNTNFLRQDPSERYIKGAGAVSSIGVPGKSTPPVVMHDDELLILGFHPGQVQLIDLIDIPSASVSKLNQQIKRGEMN